MEGPSEPKRVRLWDHTPGVFASSVYLPVALCPGWLIDLQDRALTACATAWHCSVGRINSTLLHVSLSRTLPLHRDARSRLAQRVGAMVANSEVCAFNASATRLCVLASETCETSFVVLALEAPELDDLVKELDKELILMHLPTFPSPPVFHVSLAWVDGDWTSEEFQKALCEIDVGEGSLKLTECVLKIGDVMHSFSLPVV